MDQLNEIITVLLILIPLSAVPRALQCLNMIMTDSEQEGSYRRRLKNLLIFVAIAECSLSVIYWVRSYF